MFEKFEAQLKKDANLSDQEVARVREFTVHKKLRRRHYLLQEGKICMHVCFVADGCLRSYRVSGDGSEYIMDIAVATWWLCDPESFNNGTPAKNNIDALTDSELFLIEKNDLNLLCNEIPNLRTYREYIKNKSYHEAQDRIMSNINDTAEERYNNFIRLYPEIFNCVPMHMIASYLGISRETLSRIRSNANKKKFKFTELQEVHQRH